MNQCKLFKIVDDFDTQIKYQMLKMNIFWYAMM